MKDCIFCKIVDGEIPSEKVYEDDSVLAFMDVNPVSRGHVLVIPKNHAVDVFDVEDSDLRDVASVAKKIASAFVDAFGADGVNIVNANRKAAQQSVFHLHFHVIARYEADELDVWPHNSHEGDIQKEAEKIRNSIK